MSSPSPGGASRGFAGSGASEQSGPAERSGPTELGDGTGPGAGQGDGPGQEADDVDRVIGAWHRERPDLDLSPLTVLSRVSRLARRLDLARESAFGAHDLARWEFDVLVALRRTGPPYRLSPGQLLAETLVSSGTMTHRIDRLEKRGLVRRLPVPDDRRGTFVALTDAGRRQVDDAFVDLLAAEAQLLDGLDDRQRTALAAALRHLLLRFETMPD